MKTNKRHLLVTSGSLLAATILSGVAVAGNPHGASPGQSKGQLNASTSSSATVSNNSTGVKSSSTSHFQTHAVAGSNGTKSYGNGKTAGQIAEKNGASATANLYGPGNSQPHKTSLCGGSKHMVDVHALKAHGGASSCASSSTGSTSTPTSTSSSASASTNVTAHGNGVSGAAKAKGQTNTKGGGAFTPPSSNGGVSGAQHSVSNQARPAHAVLGSANFTG
jgi:hypothetical protein